MVCPCLSSRCGFRDDGAFMNGDPQCRRGCSMSSWYRDMCVRRRGMRIFATATNEAFLLVSYGQCDVQFSVLQRSVDFMQHVRYVCLTSRYIFRSKIRRGIVVVFIFLRVFVASVCSICHACVRSIGKIFTPLVYGYVVPGMCA